MVGMKPERVVSSLEGSGDARLHEARLPNTFGCCPGLAADQGAPTDQGRIGNVPVQQLSRVALDLELGGRGQSVDSGGACQARNGRADVTVCGSHPHSNEGRKRCSQSAIEERSGVIPVCNGILAKYITAGGPRRIETKPSDYRISDECRAGPQDHKLARARSRRRSGIGAR